MNKKWLVSLLLVLFVLVLAACNNDDQTEEETNDDTETQEEDTAEDNGTANTEESEMPEADLEGIPEVVAEVNGEEIQRETFETTYEGQLQQMSMQAQMSGEAAEIDQDQLKTQVAEGMVGQELLKQEANNRDYQASEEDIDEVLNGLVEQNGLESKEDLLAALEEQGTDQAEVMSQIELQVKIDQLIASDTDTEPTDEEVQTYYDQLVEQQEDTGGEEVEIPSFEEVKPQIAAQLKSQKEAEATQTLINSLREDAEVTINL